MDKSILLKKLRTLAQVDIDTAYSYRQALEAVLWPEWRAQLRRFQADHEMHVVEIFRLIRGLGGEVPELSRDMKGFLLEGFTRIESKLGVDGALRALQLNELLANKYYAESASLSAPEAVCDVLRKNYEEEKQHLEFITNCIRLRSKESKPKSA